MGCEMQHWVFERGNGTVFSFYKGQLLNGIITFNFVADPLPGQASMDRNITITGAPAAVE